MQTGKPLFDRGGTEARRQRGENKRKSKPESAEVAEERKGWGIEAMAGFGKDPDAAVIAAGISAAP